MNFNVSVPQVPGYTPDQTRAAFNQQLAQAHAAADPRYNMKPMDRAGVSRGGAQQAMAGIASAQNLAEGIAKAYTGQLSDAQFNAGLGNQSAAESLGLSMSGIAQQQQYANALAALQRQQQQQGILSGLLNGDMNSFLGF